jgi:hypothetical protein
VLTVTVVYLVSSILFTTGARVVSENASWFAEDEPTAVSRGAARGIANLGVMAAVLVTLVAGTIVRLVGFVRSLETPVESGAKGLAVGMLACELLLLAAVGATAAGVLLIEPFVVLGGLGAVGLTALAGLLVQLFFLGQIGGALNSKALPGKLRNFVFWLVGGTLTAASVIGMMVLAPQAVFHLFAFMPCIGTLLFVGVLAGAALTVLIKYLGLLTLASDEIRKRVGKARRL